MPDTKPQRARTFLRWAGSKRQLLPLIEEHFPTVKPERYIEPFAGSACLFFSLAPNSAILADINTELMLTYRAVRKHPDKVSEALKGRRRSKREFLRLRSIDPRTLRPAARAARFIYLNRFCFNGLYRTNQSGVFNVPFGASHTGKLPSPEALAACSKALRRVTLLTGDFERATRHAKRGDFVYMDPPYVVDTRRVFSEYHPTIFSAKDVNRVRRVMERLNRRGVRFVVSYADSPEAEILRQGFCSTVVSVRRNIAGFTSRRKSSNEVLIWNRVRSTHGS
jgi:DNA adenine methylase